MCRLRFLYILYGCMNRSSSIITYDVFQTDFATPILFRNLQTVMMMILLPNGFSGDCVSANFISLIFVLVL